MESLGRGLSSTGPLRRPQRPTTMKEALPSGSLGRGSIVPLAEGYLSRPGNPFTELKTAKQTEVSETNGNSEKSVSYL